MSERIIIISGATACGKSNLAMQFGDKKNIAIINADSLQIYQGLPILSAQPSKAEQEKIPHFLYSKLKPNENCSVGIWLDFLQEIIPQIWQKNLLPVLVGGTGMYISSLIEGISLMPKVSAENKKKAEDLYKEIGHEKFKEKFGSEKIIDKQRLLRAAEIFFETGKEISFWQNQEKKKIFANADFIHVNLEIPREELYQKCNLRFEQMIKDGALGEVTEFLKLNPKQDWQITKTLGFAEISLFLQKEISYEQMLEIATQKTRNYAKRQLTWFRNQLPNKTNFNDIQSALNFLDSL